MSKKLLNLLSVILMLAVLVPTTLAAPPVQEEGQDYVVVADDWLSKLAEKYLGNSLAYTAIVEYTNQKNAEDDSYAKITDPDLIEVGWKIYIPSAEEAAKLGGEQVAKAPVMGGSLVFGLSWEPRTFDPHVTSSWEGYIVSPLVFDMLIQQGPDGAFHPNLATDWEISDDGLIYTFHLRDDVTFHDGTPFNAEAVKYSFERIMDPATMSESANTLLGPYESTEIVDDYTVKVHLSEPFGPFLNGIVQHSVAMVSPAAAEQWGEDFVDHMVGTGPFIFKEWVRRNHVKVVRNPDYNWAPDFYAHQGPPYLEEVTFKFIPEALVRTGTLETGETHMINDVLPEDFERLDADPAYTTYAVAMAGVPAFIGMNVTRPPLDDLKVRQALEYAIDRQAIVDTLYAGLYPIAYGPLTSDILGYWAGAEEMYGYDPAKAESLLAEAGWVDTDGDGIRDKDGQPLELWWPAYEWQRMNEMAEIVQAQLREIGVDLTVDVMTWPASYEAWNKCEHHMVDAGFGDLDPNVLSYLLLSSNIGSGYAVTCIKDDHIDDLLIRGRVSTDRDERIAIYTELQQIIMNQALFVPIRHYTNLVATRATVKDLRFDPSGVAPMFYDVYLEE